VEDFIFHSPTKIIFGKDVQKTVGEHIKEFDGKKVLIHYGSDYAVSSGLIGEIEESLKREKLEYVKFGGVKPNPRSSLIYEAIEICKREKIDFILAVGGGSVIDSSKAVAAGVFYEGDFWDFYSNKAKVKTALPIGVVLTIAAAGSEVSSASVVNLDCDEKMVKRGCGAEAMRPKFSIMNPELTTSLSRYQTAAGIVDIMAHVMERYFTNTVNVDLTDRLCESVLVSVINETGKVMKNPKDYDARANIMWAGTVAHNNITGVGREQDWASHSLEHELSALYDCAHGAGLSVVFPAWMEHVMEHNMMKFAQFATRVFSCEMDFENPDNTAKKGINCLRSFWKSIDMPLNFSELGARREDIPKLLDMLEAEKRDIGSFVKLKREDCEEIYRIAADYSNA
jgi:alcohol dehydrogenase